MSSGRGLEEAEEAALVRGRVLAAKSPMLETRGSVRNANVIGTHARIRR